MTTAGVTNQRVLQRPPFHAGFRNPGGDRDNRADAGAPSRRQCALIVVGD
jgi:hypothetical protein